MDLVSILVWLIVGGVAGWLAGLIMGSSGSVLSNIVLGIIGAVVAGFLLPLIGLNIGGGWLGALVNATIGAVIVILIVRLLRRA